MTKKTPDPIEIVKRLDKALRLLLDVAQHEINRFHESATYDLCERAVDAAAEAMPELTKELCVFLVPCDRFKRDASDKSILTAWRSGKSGIEKYTPDELAAMLNDSDGGRVLRRMGKVHQTVNEL